MTRILIADDSLPVRCGLRMLLGLNSDWQVCGEAVDGADAVEKAYQLAPDLILMDLSMPQMDGVQAAREIAKSGKGIPILLFAPILSPQIIESARNAGPRCDFKIRNQQVALCHQSARTRRDFLLRELGHLRGLNAKSEGLVISEQSGNKAWRPETGFPLYRIEKLQDEAAQFVTSNRLHLQSGKKRLRCDGSPTSNKRECRTFRKNWRHSLPNRPRQLKARL